MGIYIFSYIFAFFALLTFFTNFETHAFAKLKVKYNIKALIYKFFHSSISFDSTCSSFDSKDYPLVAFSFDGTSRYLKFKETTETKVCKTKIIVKKMYGS